MLCCACTERQGITWWPPLAVHREFGRLPNRRGLPNEGSEYISNLCMAANTTPNDTFAEACLSLVSKNHRFRKPTGLTSVSKTEWLMYRRFRKPSGLSSVSKTDRFRKPSGLSSASKTEWLIVVRKPSGLSSFRKPSGLSSFWLNDRFSKTDGRGARSWSSVFEAQACSNVG